VHFKFAIEGKKLDSGRNFLFTGVSDISHVQPEDEDDEQGSLMQASFNSASQNEGLLQTMNMDAEHAKRIEHYNPQLGRDSHQSSVTREHGLQKVQKHGVVRVEPRPPQNKATTGIQGIVQNLWH